MVAADGYLEWAGAEADLPQWTCRGGLAEVDSGPMGRAIGRVDIGGQSRGGGSALWWTGGGTGGDLVDGAALGAFDTVLSRFTPGQVRAAPVAGRLREAVADLVEGDGDESHGHAQGRQGRNRKERDRADRGDDDRHDPRQRLEPDSVDPHAARCSCPTGR